VHIPYALALNEGAWQQINIGYFGHILVFLECEKIYHLVHKMDLNLENLNLNTKKTLNIVFVGHVDSGKSTICGRILVDLQLVDERILEKYRQQSEESNRASWYLSWCMDLNPEEREKGKTVEVGTASFELPHTKVNVLDAPGHKQFVNEMIEGASRADIGILIVSSRTGEFEAGFKGGQTKEHMLLLKAGNVDRLIVLVNKMDECSWDRERYNEIVGKVEKFGKNLFKDMYFIPVSGYNGDNIKTRKETDFFKGPSFLEYLDTVNVLDVETEPCLTILEKVKTSGNVFFYVKIESGAFNKNDGYRVLPLCKDDKITSIMNEDDVELGEAVRGETYKMKFKELSEDIFVGTKIVSVSNKNYQVCNEMYAQLGICEVKTAITKGYACIMHINLFTVGAKITELYSLDKKKIRVGRKGGKSSCKNKA
ncbi:small GTP-binding protein domain protein, partial [Vittaforma corneae ATCC 50505]